MNFDFEQEFSVCYKLKNGCRVSIQIQSSIELYWAEVDAPFGRICACPQKGIVGTCARLLKAGSVRTRLMIHPWDTWLSVRKEYCHKTTYQGSGAFAGLPCRRRCKGAVGTAWGLLSKVDRGRPTWDDVVDGAKQRPPAAPRATAT